jgi:hypothetical protein
MSVDDNLVGVGPILRANIEYRDAAERELRNDWRIALNNRRRYGEFCFLSECLYLLPAI